MTWYRIYLTSSLSRRDFPFLNFLHFLHIHIFPIKCLCQVKIGEMLVNLFMVEDVAGLGDIEDKLAKRTEEIISYAKCVQTFVKSLSCTVSIIFFS